MEMKICKKCLIEKPANDFHKGRGCCKLCRKEYDKIKYLNNIEKYRKYSRDRYNENPEYTKNWVNNNREKVTVIRKKYYENKMDLHDLKLEYILNHYPNRNENIYKMAG